MAPLSMRAVHWVRSTTLDNDWRQPDTPQEVLIVESWSEGVMLGSLMIMAGITVANMRRRVWLHKLILIELLLALSHGTFCFFSFKGYGWYLSSTATCLYISYWLHNVIAWIKIRPFLRKTWSRLFIGSVIFVIPVYAFEISNNFRFFNNLSDLYLSVRPYEPLFRDPWWVFTTLWLVKTIKTEYAIPFSTLFRHGPRFGMLLISMALSIVFIVVDVCASVIPHFTNTVGINPYWKFALVFKCFCDTIILDDFKTALEKLRRGVFETYETVRYDDGEDVGTATSRRGGVDQGGGRIFRPRTMSIPVSPMATREFRRKSYRFGSISHHKGQSNHLETAPSNQPSQHSASSQSTNEAEKQQGMDVESQQPTRGLANRRGSQAREAVGKVGTKLAQLPNLKSTFLAGSRRRQSAAPSQQPIIHQDNDSPEMSMTYSPLDRSITRSTSDHRFAAPAVTRQRRAVPDPHHIPTDEELEADPTGQRNFEEKRRVQVSRDETHRVDYAFSGPVHSSGSSGAGGFDAHPGEPWGLNYEGDEPWGVNQVATARATGDRFQGGSKRPTAERDDLEVGSTGEKKIDFRDAL